MSCFFFPPFPVATDVCSFFSAFSFCPVLLVSRGQSQGCVGFHDGRNAALLFAVDSGLAAREGEEKGAKDVLSVLLAWRFHSVGIL